ncbi:MAG: ABC transporter permease [Verrucomicrobiales bacterium]|nr:ABC transporter permease [Verrucomicrobiales bacterium]
MFEWKRASAVIQRAAATSDVTWMIASNGIKYRYKRSVLGPFWITISQAIYILALAVVFGGLFKMRDVDFIPFLTIGILLWAAATACMQESSTTILHRGGELKDGANNCVSLVLEVVFRNLIVFLHHIVVFVCVAIYYKVHPNVLGLLMLIPASAIFIINVFWISGILSLLIPRFRDLEPLVFSLIQIGFFVTPIMWHPSLLKEKEYLIHYNPCFHLLAIIRDPLLGEAYPFVSFGIVSIMAILGMAAYYFVLSRTVTRLPYWV